MLDKAYAARRAALIDSQKANCKPVPSQPESNDTMYLAVVDRDGNIASVIQSLARTFGAGIAVEGRGFHLHNRASGFSLDPARPNALKPRMRPFHTIIPAFMEKGDVHIGFGMSTNNLTRFCPQRFALDDGNMRGCGVIENASLAIRTLGTKNGRYRHLHRPPAPF